RGRQRQWALLAWHASDDVRPRLRSQRHAVDVSNAGLLDGARARAGGAGIDQRYRGLGAPRGLESKASGELRRRRAGDAAERWLEQGRPAGRRLDRDACQGKPFSRARGWTGELLLSLVRTGGSSRDPVIVLLTDTGPPTTAAAVSRRDPRNHLLWPLLAENLAHGRRERTALAAGERGISYRRLAAAGQGGG